MLYYALMLDTGLLFGPCKSYDEADKTPAELGVDGEHVVLESKTPIRLAIPA